MKYEQAICQRIVEAGKRLSAKNLINAIEGNLSIKQDGLLYITPTVTNKETLKPEWVAVLDENGKPVAGERKASSECRMHAAAYAIRPDAGGVVHCHAPYLTAHALCGISLTSNAYPEMMAVFKKIEIVPYGTPGTDAICAGFDPLLRNSNIVMLANHGVLSVGPTLEAACDLVEAAEAAAKVLFIARQLGTPVALPEEECRKLLSM